LRVKVVKVSTDAAESLAHGLRPHGYHADNVFTRSLAPKTYYSADLVLLDLELPGLHGLEIRRACDTLIIAVTPREATVDDFSGLQDGSCPFTGPVELGPGRVLILGDCQ
jgi:DNA-binding response OmpR family regulator